MWYNLVMQSHKKRELGDLSNDLNQRIFNTPHPSQKKDTLKKNAKRLRIRFDLFMPHQKKIKHCWSETICCWGKSRAQNAWYPRHSKAAEKNIWSLGKKKTKKAKLPLNRFSHCSDTFGSVSSEEKSPLRLRIDHEIKKKKMWKLKMMKMDR